MGAGKTTVGKLLAEKLHRPFIDIDDVIVQQNNLTIPKIFEKFGENYFRRCETDILQGISELTDNVIATGGGIVLSARNRAMMNNSGITIYLKWQSIVLYRRIKNSTHRPLLKSINESQLVRYIETMLQKRQPYYEQADIIIAAEEGTTPGEIVDHIIPQLSKKIY